MKTAYFDYNATTPVFSEVLKAMEPYHNQSFGNPSSFHQAGQIAAKAIKTARRYVANLLGAADDNEILFTSGGTESNNVAIRSALATTGRKKIITSSVEHSSVRRLCQQLAKEGCEWTEVGVDKNGQLNLEGLNQALDEKTAILSLMSANNETGILMPIREAGRMAKERGVLFHVDAVQSVGKTPIVLKEETIDFLSVSAHKLYGPKGVGVLYVRKGVEYYPLIMGGSQERGRRGGTENVAGIIGFGEACKIITGDFEKESVRVEKMRNDFEEMILEEISAVQINGRAFPRIPNTSHLNFQGVDAEPLLINLDRRGIYTSSGSACMSGSREPSHVLKAMGQSDEEANSAVRISLGRSTTMDEIIFLVEALSEAVGHLRKLDKNIKEKVSVPV